MKSLKLYLGLFLVLFLKEIVLRGLPDSVDIAITAVILVGFGLLHQRISGANDGKDTTKQSSKSEQKNEQFSKKTEKKH